MKKKVLCWSDACIAGTGFGTVSKHVMRGLFDSGKYDIDQLAINYNGEFFNRETYPYQLSPARLQDPMDPYGTKTFIQMVAHGNYDFVWILNDTFVVHSAAEDLKKVLAAKHQTGKKVPKVIFYYPVDCKVLPPYGGMLEAADWNVAYCQFGLEETKKAMPEVLARTSIINHGVDTNVFTRLPPDVRQGLRVKYFNVTDPDTFILINVNRNSVRKQLAHSILAFSEFRKQVPNSKLYLHTASKDTTIDLTVAVKDLGLSMKTDVIFPVGYVTHKPFPVPLLNNLYNCADAFLTTTLGEGWGLTHIEAMATGLPVVCPDNTTFPEQLNNGTRGYIYPCKDKVWIDNSGFRPVGRVEDIVETIVKVHNDIKNSRLTGHQLDQVQQGYVYANSLEWKKLVPKWIDLFDMVEKLPSKNDSTKSEGEIL